MNNESLEMDIANVPIESIKKIVKKGLEQFGLPAHSFELPLGDSQTCSDNKRDYIMSSLREIGYQVDLLRRPFQTQENKIKTIKYKQYLVITRP